jgi:hypothetical protein
MGNFKRFITNKPDKRTAAILTSDDQKVWRDAEVALGQFIQTQLFIAGLHESIQKDIMKRTYTSFCAICKATLDVEVIQKDNKAAKLVLVAAMEEGASTPEFDDEEVQAINAVPASNGQGPFPKRASGGIIRNPKPSSNGNDQPTRVQCRYCKKTGHVQKDCYKWKKDQAPMVNTQGEAYPSGVALIEAQNH